MNPKAGVVVVLFAFLANFFNYFDRILVSVFLPNIQKDLSLSSAEAGFLWSAFTVGYLVFSPLIGYLADKYNRYLIFGICVVTWSFATISCALINDYHLLLIARVIIGVGEAGCLAIGPAILSDRFSDKNRGKILAIFYSALPLGTTAAYLVGDLILANGWDWRHIFYLAGVPGIFVGVILLLFRDEHKSERKEALEGSGGLSAYFSLFKNRAFVLLALSQAILSFVFVPLLHFGVTFFQMERGLNDVRTRFGIIALVAGIIGSVLGGYLGDFINRRHKGGYVLVCSFSLFIGFPFLLLSLMSLDPLIVTINIFLGFTAFFTFQPCVNAQLASVVPEAQKAMAFALGLFCMHILGDTFSPPLFGFLTDALKSGMGIMFGIFVLLIPIGGYVCFACYKVIKKQF
ncbi:MAG: MFS transporter [Planctomycetes bacterium]|nr:MFS transporter [Planctomycetota bacterium]